MEITKETVTGLVTLGVPALVLAWLLLRRIPAVSLFASALILVGLGYLAASGAAGEVGGAVLARVLGALGHEVPS
ncbi:MAG: hypothetical protein GC150_02000 [Rhizobiales bacterium]|nr:hypothetical protein [Hyphomicrobiales bacterium]